MTTDPLPPTSSHPTFLFTDIVDSSKMSSAFGHATYVEKLQGPHDALLRAAISNHHGYVDGAAGDSLLVAFERAEDALDCADEIQQSLNGIHESPQPLNVKTPLTATDANGKVWTLLVRIGVHTAEREVSFDARTYYRGLPDVNFASRVMAQANANQILVSAESYRVASNVAVLKWQEWPARWLKSFEEAPQTLYEMLWDGQSRGEPGRRWLPSTFRTENDRYIPRPELQEEILSQYRLPNKDGVQARLVTLVGYGGMGKTRLAVACALQSVGLFAHGVYIVPLADRLPSPQTLVEAIGAAIRETEFAELHRLLPEKPSKLADLLPALRETFVLLVLDNYEAVHAPEVQALLRDLLNETRHLRLLATGREAVNLQALEKQIEVRGLTPEQATELFIDRAQRQPKRGTWTPQLDQDRAALAHILTLTERIPLAIELVAAWMRLRSIRKIAEELEQTPLPSLPPGIVANDLRHRSLLRSLNYSYNRLEGGLQRSLAVLSLFADTFDAESAMAACTLSDAQTRLDRLYERSLLTRTEDDEGRSRYGMLRPTRAYAADRFAALRDAADLRARYIAHYRQLVRDNDDVNDLGKLAVLEREWRNALAAADHAEAIGDAASLNSLSEYLGEFLLLRGWWSERQRLNQRALKATQRANDRQAEGRALKNLGVVYHAQGQWQRAIDCYTQSLDICKECKDRVGEGKALNNLGIVYQSQGQWQQAIDCYTQSLDICKECKDRVGEGKALNNLGIVYRAQGHWDQAIACYAQSLDICKEFKDRIGERNTLNNLGIVYAAQSQWQQAIERFEQSLVIRREFQDRIGVGQTLGNMALLYEAQGDTFKALERGREALQVLETTEDRRTAEEVRALIAKWEEGR